MSISNILNGVRAQFRGGPTYTAGVRNLAQQSLRELPAAELYAVLRAMYYNTGLYDELSSIARLRNAWAPALKGLYNPTNRSCEFFAAKTLGYNPEIESENDLIIPAIEQVWKWSNFSNNSVVMSRTLAITGDCFIKVAQSEQRDRVYLQMIQPEYVIDWDEDERANITFIRVEIPMTERGADGKASSYTHVEAWSKDLGNYRRWKIVDPYIRLNAVEFVEDLARFGTPDEEIALDAMGLSWIPFTHARFRDVGEPRGQAAIMPAFDKVHEANLMSTRLHQLLFRYANVTQAIQSAGRDPTGRPIPPPAVGGTTVDDDGTVILGDDVMVRLPAGWELTQLVPQLPYDEALAILNDQMAEIEKDLPELAYFNLRDKGVLSGVAVRMLLGDAIDRALEARRNLTAVLVRADQMALTMGAAASLPLFQNIGTYENGDFEHEIECGPIFPESEQEEAQTELTRAQAFKAYREAGFPATEALAKLGYQGDELLAVTKAMITEADTMTATNGVQ